MREGYLLPLDQFDDYLRRGGRSENARIRALRMVSEFKAFFAKNLHGKDIDDASHEDILTFVHAIEQNPGDSAKTHLWALSYYYQFKSNDELLGEVTKLRQDRIKRVPFAIAKFRGISENHVKELSAAGIDNVDQMLAAGKTPKDRKILSEETGVPLDAILELVKLSDLSRVGALKSIRARLYFDAGVDTPEKLAAWDPNELREMLIRFVEESGFDGIAPLPKEALSAVTKAKKLPTIIEY